MSEVWQWFGDNHWAAWAVLAVALAAVELASLDLVLLMLAGGALVAALVSFLGAGWPVEVLVAAASSVAFLGLVRPNLVKRLHAGPDLVTGPAKLVGRQGIAVSEVSVHGGQIRIGGELWTARPYDDTQVIEQGATVDVFSIEGATALVYKVPELDSGQSG